MLRKVKFHKHCDLGHQNSILYNLFYFTLIHNNDNMLRTVFMPQCSAVDLMYHLFDVYVSYAVCCCFCVVLFCAGLCE